MKVPEFDQSYREARRDAFRQSVARLQQASGAAVTTLLKIMVDGSAPASTRLLAADIVLAHTSKAIEIEDVESRVAALERAAEASKQDRFSCTVRNLLGCSARSCPLLLRAYQALMSAPEQTLRATSGSRVRVWCPLRFQSASSALPLARC